ncbi:hypothetical protein ACRAWF_41800 [Streptomyces sp. L7]
MELALLLPSHSARLRYERAQLLVERGDFLAGGGRVGGVCRSGEGGG